MIRRRAVKAYFERPRKDYRSFKKLSDGRLEELMDQLPSRPPIWDRLDHLQKVCFIIGATTKRFFFLNDTGTGKTLLSIALARYFRRIGEVRRVLVLVPNRINKTEWLEELRKHSPKSKAIVLGGASKQKWQDLEETSCLFVFETYAGLARMVCEVKRNKKGRNRLVPNKKLVSRLAAQFDGLIGDESTSVKNHQALPYRLCRKLSKASKIVFMLTGTPFNRDPSELWTQMFLVDHGQTLGETLGLFRGAFFKEKLGGWSVEYEFDKKKEQLVNQVLANRSISFEADEASLPRVVEIKKMVTLPDDADTYYQKARQTIIGARGNYVEMRNAFLRMRQISSGFLGYQDDESGERAKFVFPDNPKLDQLLSLVRGIRPDHKVVVFYDFTYSGERIAKELADLGIGVVQMYGKTKQPDRIRDQFVRDADIQVLVLQNQFGLGLNIQVAKYGIYYESPVSAIMRKQTRRRVERQKSPHRSVFIYDLLVKGTVDEKILAFHKEGQDLFAALIRGEVKV